jgi:hypothetical protein
MFVTADTEVTAQADPNDLWEYAADPANWTASNPKEHYGLIYFCPENRPAQGVEFHQRERVAGMYADLRGRIVYMEKPNLTVWAGTATYKLFWGLFQFRLPEGGVLKLERTESGTKASHNVYIDFPNSLWGRMLRWVFLNILNGQKAVYDHTYRELVYFKEKLENK